MDVENKINGPTGGIFTRQTITESESAVCNDEWQPETLKLSKVDSQSWPSND